MIEGTNLSSIIDIGFYALVIFTCYRALFNTPSASDGASREKWKLELTELEKMLRNLIEEAGAASRNLDRSLLKRKRELETLLTKLEDAAPDTDELAPTQSIPRPRIQRRAPAVPTEKTTSEPAQQLQYTRAGRPPKPAKQMEELPNESWLEPSRDVALEDDNRVHTNLPSLDIPQLEMLAEQTDDPITVGVERAIREQEREIPGSTTPTTLNEQLEIEDVEDRLAHETFQKTSIMDPVTYKIARRLLAGGREIHVVARKLDLPISEIRLLDRLMRNEGKQTLTQQIETNRVDSEAEEQPTTVNGISREVALL